MVMRESTENTPELAGVMINTGQSEKPGCRKSVHEVKKKKNGHRSEIVKWPGGYLYQKGFGNKASNSRPISQSSDPSVLLCDLGKILVSRIG